MTPLHPIIIIEGDEQSRLDPALPDGGLPPAVGVQSWQVFRASSAVPDLTDGRGWTYHHHVDMACWRGRLYVGWNSCEKDEDVWPSRELYSTSSDGATWDQPRELFPQGISTPLRMYFFLARNGRMLAIAGLRLDNADTREDRKGGLVVREIGTDHALGPVHALQLPTEPVSNQHPPLFDTSGDAAFIEACRQLLADTIYLEQQDRGRLLGERRMKWHDATSWPDGKVPGDNDKWVCGKAWSFYRRPDGVRVGISKMGWCTCSTDDGATWAQPDVPPTLVTGKAKVWTQRTADGRFALVYNPSKRQRFPLAMVTGDDGRTFGGMRIVQGELPRQRYAGLHRSIGPQYTRGISEWADDGSRNGDGAMWLVYSINKEDIWVSRVPLPVQVEETRREFSDELEHLPTGPIVPGWNTYAPRWGRVAIDAEPDGASSRLWLETRDPHDYARAVRVVGPRERMTVSFEIQIPTATKSGGLEIELLDQFGAARPVRLLLAASGQQSAAGDDAQATTVELPRGQWVRLTLVADVATARCSLWQDDACMLNDQPFVEPAAVLHRVSFRTGPWRGIGGANPVEPETDRPTPPAAFALRRFRVQAHA